MTHIAIGDVELGTIPRVVAIVDSIVPINTIIGLKDRGADILEIRVDLFSCEFSQITEYLQKVCKKIDMPLIGTIRKTEANIKNRLALFEQILPFVDAVDIEIDADIVNEVVTLFNDKTVIISEHDFDKTPDRGALNGVVESAGRLGADIIKIAAMAHSREDVIRLLSFTKERKEHLVTIAMGEMGNISRIVAPFFGSLFTYAFLNEAVAPGQLSLGDLVRELKTFYPEIRQ